MALKYAYIAVECIALAILFWRRVPIWIFQAYVLVSIVAGLTWVPAIDATWWVKWLLIFDPIRLALMAGAIIEVGYYATIAMFQAERIAMAGFLCGIWVATFMIMFTMPITPIGIISGIREAVMGADALVMIAGCLYLWSKPVAPTPQWVSWHAVLLTSYLCVETVVGLLWHPRGITTNAQWWTGFYADTGVKMLCMIAWCILAMRYRERYRADPSIRASLRA